ncbi:ATP-dependent Clp protease ATP-binding subunit [[Mycoplasma] gypis]|uniref:AAA family ATPase n=1 Tax=[Mycoplasma] gypis TaxID=92404 RepID=A0ABZ2RPT3_9BACT|nr:AAA family ATPase [[Mycoplasma] gypis]MBN0919070.1 AAA family ATPase [[Mycoplasma] gypis]
MEANWQPNEQNQDPLKQYGRNLIELAKSNKLEPVVNRDDEIRRLIRILSRKSKNNPVLVGEPGVGKTAIVEGLARKIVENQVPENLKNKQLWEIDLPAMIAGAMYQGQFEQRLKKLMETVEKSDGNIILFIDEIHMLVGAGKTGQGAMDAANIFKPLMARGQLHLIGATTLDEYRQYIETDPALERRMQKVNVNEPSIEDTVTILRGIKERYETYHGVKIEDKALIAAANLSARYISDRFLPDKAIDLIDEAAATIKTEMNSQPEELEKIKQKIARLEMEKAALKTDKSASSETKILEIKQQLSSLNETAKTLQQKWDAEKKLINDISNFKQELDHLRNRQNVLQSNGDYVEASKILYVKIPELTKKLQEAEEKVKADKNRLVKEVVDEEEVAEIVSKWTKIPVAKLIESQRDKVLNLDKTLKSRIKGQDEACESVAKAILRSKANINDPNRPLGSFIFLGTTGVGKTELAKALAYSLFDNENQLIRLDMSEYMEKHSVSKLIGSPPGYVGFEQGGQLTEKIRQNPYSIVLFDEVEKAHPEVWNILLQILDNGFVTDSKGKNINFRNTIIILTSNLGAELIAKGKATKDDLRKELLKVFRPEFLNRIDEIITFNRLDRNAINNIVSLELNKLKSRILKQTKIDISFDNEIIDYIGKEAYDPENGARPIKRYIQNNIENLLAYNIVDQKIKEDDKAKIYLKDKKFIIDKL